MKKFLYIVVLYSFTLTAQASVDEPLLGLFEGCSEIGEFCKTRAQKDLETIQEDESRFLAVEISKITFPDSGDMRGELLSYLTQKCHTSHAFNNAFVLLLAHDGSYAHLELQKRFDHIRGLLNSYNLDSLDDELKSETLDLLGQVKPILYPSVHDPSIEEHGLQLVRILEEALERRSPQDTAYPFLRYEEGKSPLPFFLQFANALSNYKNKGPLQCTDTLCVWGILAKSYLKIAIESFVGPKQHQETQTYFIPELKEKIQKRHTTYEWFTLFTNRLSILMTPPFTRRTWHGFNSRFDSYKNALTDVRFANQEAWYTHADYEKACNLVGLSCAQKAYSPLALAREPFPDIVMLPYPFALSDADILSTLPRPGGSHLWLLGCVLTSEWADGGHLNPSLFRAHDEAHFAEMLFSLSCAGNLFIDNDETFVPSSQGVWLNNRKGKELYYEALKRVQEMIADPQEDDDENQKRMNAFLGFFIFHENSASLYNRMDNLIKIDGFLYSSNSLKNIKNPHYYEKLFPDVLKETLEDVEHFKAKSAPYLKKFLETFSRTPQGKDLITSIKHFCESERLLFYGSAPENHKTIYLFYTHSVEIPCYETQEMTQEGDEITLPRDDARQKMLKYLEKFKPGSFYKRYYFMGSPFYNGPETPKFGEEKIRIAEKSKNGY